MSISFFRKYPRTKTGILVYFLLMIQSTYGQFHPIAKESSINFTIHNFGFKVTGSLDASQGDFHFNPDSLTNSFFHVTIKSESINTDNDSRDEHLRKEDYFDVKNYPLISFVSENIHINGKNNGYEALGKLTIKNKTKDIQLAFTAEKSGNGYLFTGSFKMDRRDFGVGGSSTISNELTVNIKVLAR
ncbi:MAG TPA: YceI family protein [Puia sp.]